MGKRKGAPEYQQAKREESYASRAAKVEPGKHNRKAGRRKRTGNGGGERIPCPIQKAKITSTKKQAIMQQIAERVSSVDALPESEHTEVGLAGSSKGAKKRRRREAAAAALRA